MQLGGEVDLMDAEFVPLGGGLAELLLDAGQFGFDGGAFGGGFG